MIDDMPDSLRRLPLFATDAELAVAIVGRKGAERWRKDRLPTLASKPGFPPIDAFHGGRAVPLVWRFYVSYFNMTATHRVPVESDQRGLEGEWRKPRHKKETSA